MLVPRDVAAAAAFEPLRVDAPTVKIQREELAAILRRPVVALIDQRALVRVAAAEIVRRAVARRLPALARIEVVMIGVRVESARRRADAGRACAAG
jgi:hypothetical protein